MGRCVHSPKQVCPFFHIINIDPHYLLQTLLAFSNTTGGGATSLSWAFLTRLVHVVLCGFFSMRQGGGPPLSCLGGIFDAVGRVRLPVVLCGLFPCDGEGKPLYGLLAGRFPLPVVLHEIFSTRRGISVVFAWVFVPCGTEGKPPSCCMGFFYATGRFPSLLCFCGIWLAWVAFALLMY